MKHNILFLIGTYPSLGGTEKVTTILANKFANDGNNVHIASFRQSLEISRMNLSTKVGFLALSSRVICPKNICTFKHYLKENNIDIIINQWCLPFYVTWFIDICKPKNCKVISVLHGMPDRSKKLIVARDNIDNSQGVIKRYINKLKFAVSDNIIRRSIKYVYKHTDKYVLLSKSFESNLVDYAHLNDTSKITSIGNPITIEMVPSKTGDLDYSLSKTKSILYVGRMDKENKRVNRIVEAWAEIAEKYSDWSLDLVGDGPALDELKEFVAEYNVPRVVFWGFVKEDPIEFYKKSSILMLTSDLEGFGLVVIEGMAYGVIPVVYGSYKAIYDIIEDGKNGFITDMPYSKDQTVKRIQTLIESPDILVKMRAEAVKSSKRFILDSVVEQWYNIFE